MTARSRLDAVIWACRHTNAAYNPHTAWGTFGSLFPYW